MLMLNEIRKKGAIVNTITLQPLSENSLNQLIASTLKCSLKLAQPLQQLVYQKTKGNPFFSTQFLKALYEDKLIKFNLDAGHWECDIVRVKEAVLCDDVVEFIAWQLQKLPAVTQEILKLAACIGNQFNLSILAVVCEKSETETAANLWKALQEGFILPQNDIYKFYIDREINDITQGEEIVVYKFLHDRVQQAAYSLIPEDQKQKTHLKIGQLLLKNTTQESLQEKVFEIVNQLNIGKELISLQFQREQLVELNLIAGYKAKTSTAYEAAAKYFEAGIELLIQDSWRHQYSLSFRLHKELAEVEFLCSHFENSERIIDLSLQEAQSVIDKAELYNLLIIQYTLQAKYLEAIEIGRQALALLDINLPSANLPDVLEPELLLASQNLGNRQIASLAQETDIQDTEKRMAIAVLQNIDAPAYFTNLELYSVIVVKSVNLSIQYGNAPESPKGYSTYGLLLGALKKDYQSGYQFGCLALQIAENFRNLAQKTQVCVIIVGYLNHWVKHLKFAETLTHDGYQAGLDSGELQFAGYMLIFKSLNSFHKGLGLDAVLEEALISMEFCQKTKNKWAIDAILGCQILASNLNGLTPDNLSFEIAHVNEFEYVSFCEINQSFSWLCTYKIIKSRILYLYGDFAKSLDCLKKASSYLNSILGHFSTVEYNLFTSLNLLALYQHVSDVEQENYRHQLVTNQKQMQYWAENSPDNFLHKYLLVEAEINRINGQMIEAMDFYDQAISSATQNDFIQDAALANELAAKFYLNWGKEKVAAGYMQEAYYCYARWGAKAKTDDLEKCYSHLLKPILQQQKITLNSLETIATKSFSSPTTGQNGLTISSTSTTISDTLDFTSILKASQNLSSEIELDKVIENLMQILLQNTGATKGALILPKGENWLIASIVNLHSHQTQQQMTCSIMSLDFTEELPKKIIYTVKNTLESIIFHDINQTNLWAGDEYLMRQQPQSVLCTPIFNQGKLRGILYLENQLTSGVFTNSRIQTIHLLCTQAAISIENATLYNALEQKVIERTQELSQTLENLKATHKKLIEAEKMAALGGLVAGVAHEINTPLGSSITVTSMLVAKTQTFVEAIAQGAIKRSLLQEYADTAQESSNLILGNLQRAGDLVQSFKQIAVDQSNLEQRKFAVKQYLEEILLSLSPKLNKLLIILPLLATTP
jgi:predicted ATPase/GAF domain-containing protein